MKNKENESNQGLCTNCIKVKSVLITVKNLIKFTNIL